MWELESKLMSRDSCDKSTVRCAHTQQELHSEFVHPAQEHASLTKRCFIRWSIVWSGDEIQKSKESTFTGGMWSRYWQHPTCEKWLQMLDKIQSILIWPFNKTETWLLFLHPLSRDWLDGNKAGSGEGRGNDRMEGARLGTGTFWLRRFGTGFWLSSRLI